MSEHYLESQFSPVDLYDSKGLWSAHVEQTVKDARWMLGAIKSQRRWGPPGLQGLCPVKARVQKPFILECSRDPPD